VDRDRPYASPECSVVLRMSLQWYALRSKPNSEDALWRDATARGFEVYYPRTRVQPVNPRARKTKPYFPGYMFVRADIASAGYSTFAWMPYSKGLVRCGSDPSPVPDPLIHAMRRRVESINAAGGELFDGLKRGQAVAIQAGAFAGSEAIFDSRLSGSQRVRILLQLLNKQWLPLELPAGQVRRKDRR
jgi:transcription antitermination factor NusG